MSFPHGSSRCLEAMQIRSVSFLLRIAPLLVHFTVPYLPRFRLIWPTSLAFLFPVSPYFCYSFPLLLLSPLLLPSATKNVGHDLGSVSHDSDVSLTPPSTPRSVTGSLPRGVLTSEQRELKRQRDLARRGSKASMRARRGMSGSYSSHSPPM